MSSSIRWYGKKTFHILPSLGDNRISLKQAKLGLSFAWVITEKINFCRSGPVEEAGVRS
jgi:hypothetical protein